MKHHAIPPAPNPDSLEAMVETFKALADSTRARLVLLLAAGERSVSDLVVQLEQPQSTVSRHLALLRAADLVSTRRDGVRVFYRLKDAHVGDLVAQAFAHAEHERLGLPDHANSNHGSSVIQPRLEVRR